MHAAALDELVELQPELGEVGVLLDHLADLNEVGNRVLDILHIVDQHFVVIPLHGKGVLVIVNGKNENFRLRDQISVG